MPNAMHAGGLTPMRRLLRLLAAERGEVALVYLYAALSGALGLALPLGVQAIVGLVSGGMLLQPAVLLIAFVVLGTVASGALQLVQLAAVERLQQRVFARLALSWGALLPSVRLERVAELPEAVTRFFEIVVIQKSLAKLLTESVGAALAVVAGLLLLAFYHPALSITGTLLLAGLAAALWSAGRRGFATSLEESHYKYRVAAWLQQIARHVRIFQRADVVPRHAVARVDEEVVGYLAARQAHFRVLVRQSIAAIAFRTLVTGALLVLGAWLVVGRQITLGQFVASELVVVGVLGGVEKLVLGLGTVYDALTSAEKLGAVDDLEVTTLAGTLGAAPAAPLGSRVSMRGVRYAGATESASALHGVSLEIAPGERVGVLAAEGGGASTVLAVLAGLATDFGGSATLDGVSLRDLEAGGHRARVALVGDRPGIFDGTVEENIVVGRVDVSDDDVRRAIEVAGLESFLHASPAGLRTRVGGAQPLAAEIAWRIALARAIAGRPTLLLLDELFHHVHPSRRGALIDRLFARDAGWTIVGASHDAVFLAAVDRVLVLDGGRVTRDGPPAYVLDAPEFGALVNASALQTPPR